MDRLVQQKKILQHNANHCYVIAAFDISCPLIAQMHLLPELLTADQRWKEDRGRRRKDRKGACCSSLMARPVKHNYTDKGGARGAISVRGWICKPAHCKEALKFLPVSLNSTHWEFCSSPQNRGVDFIIQVTLILMGLRNLVIKNKLKLPKSACMSSSGSETLPYWEKRLWKQL